MSLWNRRKGASVLASVIAIAVVALFLLFLYKVFLYYTQIRSGDVASLPQFTAQLTVDPAAAKAEAEAGATAQTADDPASGPDSAKLTVVEFLDYQCPYCNDASSTVRSLAAEYGDRVRFQIRDFPVLELHPDALVAAEAAGCAEAQGKFWIMHDRLFALRGTLDRASLDQAAQQSGVDFAKFKTCMDTHARLSEIKADVKDGQSLGVRGTPTFFFNGRRIEGVIPPDVFRTLIESFLRK